jgi:hypothetical protein
MPPGVETVVHVITLPKASCVCGLKRVGVAAQVCPVAEICLEQSRLWATSWGDDNVKVVVVHFVAAIEYGDPVCLVDRLRGEPRVDAHPREGRACSARQCRE